MVIMFITFLALSSSFIEVTSSNIMTRVSIDKAICRCKLNAYTDITIRAYIIPKIIFLLFLVFHNYSFKNSLFKNISCSFVFKGKFQ